MPFLSLNEGLGFEYYALFLNWAETEKVDEVGHGDVVVQGEALSKTWCPSQGSGLLTNPVIPIHLQSCRL